MSVGNSSQRILNQSVTYSRVLQKSSEAVQNQPPTHSNIFQHLEFINIIIKSAEATSITITNIIVILLYLGLKRKRNSVANYLIFSQSLADLFVGLMTWIQICMQAPTVQNSHYVHFMYMLYMCMLEYSLILTLGSLLLAAFERYLCITKMIFHRKFVTKNRVILGTAIVWILSLIPPLILMILMDFKYINCDIIVVTVYSCVFDVVMLILIAVVVVLLIASLKISKRSCDRRRARSRSLNEKEAATKRTTRLVMIFLCMIIAYAVTFLPFAGTRLMYDIGILASLPPPTQIILFIVCNTFYKSSSLFNPLLSIAMKKDYWQLLVRMCRYRKQLSRRKAIYNDLKKQSKVTEMKNRVENNRSIGRATSSLPDEVPDSMMNSVPILRSRNM